MALYLLKLLPSILLLLLQRKTAHAQLSRPYYCAEYSSDKTFKKNLEGLFNHIMCNNCLQTVVKNIISYCPDSKVVGYWEIPAGPCFIRYSNKSFFNVANTTSYIIPYNQKYSNHELFNNTRNTLFDKLIARINKSENMMEHGSNGLADTDILYGLLQCTRDLNQQECYKCLSELISFLQPPSLYEYTIGLRLIGFSCYVRYEMVPFVPPQEGPDTKTPKKWNMTVMASVLSGVATFLFVITICIWFQRKRSPFCTSVLIDELQVAASDFLIYDLTTIRIATDNFSDRNTLGRGGFGPVFKATFPNGQAIAVKRLSTGSTQGATEFKNEVELLVRLRHKNLVRLLGCCISNDERMLCYEYLPKRSLDTILFGTDEIKCKELEWSRRLRIIKCICRGLLYLHEESPLRIVHRDLKASNILLDRDMNPKIADFGLARLFNSDQTHNITSRIAGSFGYIAPEYGIQGRFSAKSDTYSFGILVLEIVSGRNNSSFPGSKFLSGLTNHVWKNWNEGKVLELKDPTLDQECLEEVTKCIHIALLCLQANPSKRPNMETVANMLNVSSIASLPPLPPSRFIWGADVPTFEDDENVVANLNRELYSVVGLETAEDNFLSSFNRRA